MHLETVSTEAPTRREANAAFDWSVQRLALAELRTRMACTQASLAEVMGTTQSGVSRLERQQDVLVSTLRDFVAATGGVLHLVARYGDEMCDLYLPVLDRVAHEKSGPRSFRVVWQNLRTRGFVNVGALEFTGSGFTFRYTNEAASDPDFAPFQAFPDIHATYESDELFPFFAERVAFAARSDYDHLLAAFGLSRDEATPVELLARSWGTTPHDTVQIVPEPVEREDGVSVMPFLVSGARHVDESASEQIASRISQLVPGAELSLCDEPENPVNNRAILVRSDDGQVGWVPDYLLEYVHSQREAGSRMVVVVERANGPMVPWHLRLLCRLEVALSSS